MLRAEVLQPLIDLFGSPKYLEIGVHSGETFNSIRADEKTAVDPAFQFDVKQASLRDSSARYHAITSDEFFAQTQGQPPFDVVFLDGLHTFEQTLRDLLNTLSRVRKASVIVIDDVLPNGHPAAIRDLDVFLRYFEAVPGTDRAWMGDVFRLVYFIAAFMPAWSYATVAENHGQLVMWRQHRRVEIDLRVEDVARVDYTGVVLDKSAFRITPFADILSNVRESCRSR